LDVEIYFEQPKGFEKKEEEEGNVYHLKKTLYGLKQPIRA